MWPVPCATYYVTTQLRSINVDNAAVAALYHMMGPDGWIRDMMVTHLIEEPSIATAITKLVGTPIRPRHCGDHSIMYQLRDDWAS